MMESNSKGYIICMESSGEERLKVVATGIASYEDAMQIRFALAEEMDCDEDNLLVHFHIDPDFRPTISLANLKFFDEDIPF
jgi:hypothetical protein